MAFIRFLFITTLVFTTFNVNSQVLFSETFNEGDGSTSGTDDIGGISWTSSCGGCISGDIWEEKDGQFHNNDSNGPATITTNTIDITSCSNFVIEFDYNNVGDFEACGTGCNSVDWISLEYTIDGTTYSPTNSYYCDGTCASLNVIWSGVSDDDSDPDDVGNNGTYISDAISTGGGSNLEFEIGSQTWAGTEYINIDNISVTCLVPLQLDTTKVVHQQIIEEEKVISQIYNVLGQELYNLINGKEVNLSNYNGIIIIRYLDGSLRKVKIL